MCKCGYLINPLNPAACQRVGKHVFLNLQSDTSYKSRNYCWIFTCLNSVERTCSGQQTLQSGKTTKNNLNCISSKSLYSTHLI